MHLNQIYVMLQLAPVDGVSCMPWLALLALVAVAALAVCFDVTPALAQISSTAVHRAAPAPLIGAGIPGALIAGGVWVCYKLFKRQR
jgi:hypothetical protein